MFGFQPYNYDRFRREMLVKDAAKSVWGIAPEPGDKAPNFSLRTLEGDKVELSEFRGRKNVLLVFGSASCPQTAASIGRITELAEEFEDKDLQVLFVYVREAHPGSDMPAHASMSDKVHAAEILRDEEEIEFPILVDELNGKVHKKYGSLPNSSFLIDKTGRIAFRSLSSNAEHLAEAVEELLERQEQGVDSAIVCGGEDSAMPSLKMFLNAYRAVERAGDDAIDNFREQMGMPGRIALTGGRVVRPIAENPGITAASAAAVLGVIGLGLWVGSELRKRRFNRQPYDVYRRSMRERFQHSGGDDDYEAVGI